MVSSVNDIIGATDKSIIQRAVDRLRTRSIFRSLISEYPESSGQSPGISSHCNDNFWKSSVAIYHFLYFRIGVAGVTKP